MKPLICSRWKSLDRLASASLLSMCSLSPLFFGGCAAPNGAQTPITTPAANLPTTAPLDKSAVLAAPSASTSLAPSAKDYRKDAAHHVYASQSERVFKGRMPPMLYAVGVLNVDIDRQGQIKAIKWARAPTHAPEVVAEIERMVHGAAPFPVPVKLGQVTYTDVWLWDKSGRFQLDTLTEGQD
jgi:periplasmic protein TonB